MLCLGALSWCSALVLCLGALTQSGFCHTSTQYRYQALNLVDLLDIAVRKNSGSHIDAPHSRQPLVKCERLVRYEVNPVMPAKLAHSQGLKIGQHLNLLVYTIPEIACARGGEEGRGAGRRREVCGERVRSLPSLTISPFLLRWHCLSATVSQVLANMKSWKILDENILV